MITIQLFGQIDVVLDGSQVRGLSMKQRHILAILALSPGEPVPRDRLADRLWEGSPPSSYVGTLDSYVCVLRRALGLSAGRSSALATTASGFVLEVGSEVEVDLCWFERLARAAEMNRSRPALEWAEEALTVCTGELLVEVPYAEWADRARELSRARSSSSPPGPRNGPTVSVSSIGRSRWRESQSSATPSARTPGTS